MKNKTAFYLLLFSIFPSLPAHADHAIAMHGAPKYPANFAHFDYVNPAAPKGGTLRLGVTGAYDNVNPFTLRGRSAFGVNPASGQLYLYDSLMARSQDEPFTLYALVAEDVTTTSDRGSVTFRLNPAARFHDGAPISSADVAFSWEILRQKGRPNHRNYYNKVDRIETPDARTVTFFFKTDLQGKIDREMPLIMALMPVLPQHIWSKLDITAPTMTPPIGSGPYRIKSLKPGRTIVWERVPDYWARDLPSQRGLYNFDLIKVDYYRDEQVALQAFKSGQYDFRREADVARWSTAYSGAALDAGKYRLLEIPHGRVEAVRAFAFNLRRPLFQDRVLRQAISAALDFDWLNRVLFYGQLRRTASYFPNSILAATGVPDAAERALLEQWRAQLPPELFTEPVDSLVPADFSARLRAAQHKLQQAGYSLQDGQLYTPKKEPVAFTILLNEPSEEKIASHLARNLRQLGIAARVQIVESAQFQARQNEFDFDMMLVRWINSLSPGNEQAIYWGSAAAAQPGTRNYPGITSSAVDALIPQITAATSREALVTAVRALDRVLLWGFYSLPLAYQPADHIALAAGISLPSSLPTNGLVLESLWPHTIPDLATGINENFNQR